MEDGADANVDETALPEEFVAGNTADGLDKIRKRLLDLTGRNRLLNYRHPPTSCLRIVDAELDHVFQSFCDGQRFPLEPVPEPDQGDYIRPPEGGQPQKPSPEQHAKRLGWAVSYDLTPRSNHQGALRVLHYRDRLAPILRRMDSKARMIVQESGTNMLHMVFGFLEWYESEDSSEPHLAPLLTVPAMLERPRNEPAAFCGAVRHSGEDIESNLSLTERLLQDFGLSLPSRDEDEPPEAFFSKFEELLSQKRRWKLRRYLTLTFLSFGKLLMYRDLDRRNWPSDGLLQHPIVRELFEGTKRNGTIHAEEYSIDAPDMEGRVPLLVKDADSSQHSALVDALEGKNLVIEGPPGTGKSQTITNLIAVAIAQGKTVLFVAEKLAALEVVRRRLDDVNLGIFCLELHSHKAKWDKLIPDLEQRLQMKETFVDSAGIDAKRKLLKERKHLLNEYSRLINSRHEPLGLTVFDILWARERYLRTLRADPSMLLSILVPKPTEYDQEALARADHFVELYTRQLAALVAGGRTLAEHPWSWIATASWTFDQEAQLLQVLRSIGELAKEGSQIVAWLSQEVKLQIEPTSKGLTQACDWLSSLPAGNEAVIPSLLGPCTSHDNRQALQLLSQSIEEARRGIELIQGKLKERVVWSSSVKQSLKDALACLDAIHLQGHSVDQIRDAFQTCQRIRADLDECLAGWRWLTALFPVNLSASLRTLGLARKCVALIDDAPLDTLYLRTEGMRQEGARKTVEEAASEATVLAQLRSNLGQDFDLELLEKPTALRKKAAVLEFAGFWERIFGAEYRSATTAHRNICRRKRKHPQMASDLRELAEYQEKILSFVERRALTALLGGNFRGIESDWSHLIQATAWCEHVCLDLPEFVAESQPFRKVLFEWRREQITVVKDKLGESRVQLEKFRSAQADAESSLQSVQALVDYTDGMPAADLADSLQGVISTLRRCLDAFDKAHLSGTVTIPEIQTLLGTAERVDEAAATLEKNFQARALLGSMYRDLDTNVESVNCTVNLAAALDSGALPKAVSKWLLCDQYSARVRELKAQLEAAARISRTGMEHCQAISDLSGSAKGFELYNLNLNEMGSCAATLVRQHDALSQWLQHRRSADEAVTLGLAELTRLADTGAIPPDQLLPSFKLVFFNSLARAIFQNHPDLWQFAGVTQEELRKQFASLDREIIDLNPRRLARSADQKPVPHGKSSGPVSQWTELPLLTHELSKQKRHIPVRQLMMRSGAALQALKPCFMMGPLSVAQFLAPGQLKFNLVIMDEASQLRPEDAIGAVARGGQLVVVGDPKQLPPTNFFQRLAIEDEEDDTRGVAEEGESILDVAAALYQPIRRLRWHYRSRHHSLIAFSNKEFYQGNLIVFPSAYEQKDDLGIRYHHVTNGSFEHRRNPPEAEMVVDAVLEHMRVNPDESLGVVILNLEQRELIEELLDKRLGQEVFGEAYVEHSEQGAEPFFIKNLENVQGDERDVIFISCTYGPDSRGNQYQRFGPINGPNGHRRLNVLFTRARKRLEAFCSLDLDRIETGPSSAWGVRAFKGWLQFAKSGTLEEAKFSAEQPTNDFEASVAELLTQNGYEAIPQVGVAGFRIDLAIRHPYKPGAFLLGIECDGATYHSGRSARDRDRLRQEILENLGWKIHRIWSTDWFKSRQSEISRLLSTVESLLAQDPTTQVVRAKANRTQELRARLVEFRENVIRPAFPEASADRCLLHEALLEEFIRQHPTSKEDWFRRIPSPLRTSTESGQIAKFLDDVLRIIHECIS